MNNIGPRTENCGTPYGVKIRRRQRGVNRQRRCSRSVDPNILLSGTFFYNS